MVLKITLTRILIVLAISLIVSPTSFLAILLYICLCGIYDHLSGFADEVNNKNNDSN